MSHGETRPIALIGLMGAGKSTVARILGERMGGSVADLDAMIEAEEARAIADIFEREGESYFRARERELLERVLGTKVDVLACGGGIVLDERSRELLERQCHVVWLEAAPEVAAARLGAGVASRPLLAGGAPVDRLRRVLEERRDFYERLADTRIATGGLDPEQVATMILAAVPKSA